MSIFIDISKKFKGFQLDVKIDQGNDSLGILGPSGSGKSMTLRCIAGLEKPDRGIIRIGDRELFNSERKVNLPPKDRNVGYLFQNYALFPNMTVMDNIRFGSLKGSESEKYIKGLVGRFHLDGLEKRKPYQLSGGQQQRVALARVLAAKPEVIMLDEPFSALDDHLRMHMLREMKDDLMGFFGSTMFVTHNIEEAYRMCDQIAVYSFGKIVAKGEKHQIFNFPPNSESARITGCKNIFETREAGENSIEIKDLGIQLRVNGRKMIEEKDTAFIRANHVEVSKFLEKGQLDENEFIAEVVETIESPFRVSVFMKINGDGLLQAETSKDKWDSIIGKKVLVRIPIDKIVC